jgi:hypothetical protein
MIKEPRKEHADARPSPAAAATDAQPSPASDWLVASDQWNAINPLICSDWIICL